MRAKPHQHPCFHCGAKTECCGDVEQNYDGFPEWICREFDLTPEDFLCEACAAKRGLGVCEECGAWAGEAHDVGCDIAASVDRFLTNEVSK